MDVDDFDIKMMQIALEQARNSALLGEVPVGAVIVDGEDNLLAASGNNCIQNSDPAGHAEMRALRMAAGKQKNYRLPEATVYVTLEPCAMCAAALVHARIKRLVFGATDPKTGAIVSKYRIGSDGLLNHSFAVTSGLLRDECARVLKNFFKQRR